MARPNVLSPTRYEEALRWNYSSTFQHQSLAVDQIGLRVEFNQPQLVAAPGTGTDDLFGALAQYVTVAQPLWEILQKLPALENSPPTQQMEHAIETFATLAADVAAKWVLHWTTSAEARPAVHVGGPRPEVYQFVAKLDAAVDPIANKWMYTKLHLNRKRADGALGWPKMGVIVPGGDVQPMQPCTSADDSQCYEFPGGIAAFTLLGFQMTFDGLHVATYQNARSQVEVKRNVDLVAQAPTRGAFVYETKPIAFPDVVRPLLWWKEPFAIGTWSDQAASNPLLGVLDDVVDHDPANRVIAAGIRYGFELATAPPRPGKKNQSIVTYLPAKYRPNFAYDPDPANGTVKKIITEVDAWRDTYQPTSQGGEWAVTISLYSSVAGQTDKPVLQLPVASKIPAQG